MNLRSTILAYGTSEGAELGWDARGRGRKAPLYKALINRTDELPKGYTALNVRAPKPSRSPVGASKDVGKVKFFTSQGNRDMLDYKGTPKTSKIDLDDITSRQRVNRNTVELYKQMLQNEGRMPHLAVARIRDDSEKGPHFEIEDGNHRLTALRELGYRGMFRAWVYE